MARVRRGGYILTWFIGDHALRHVHVQTDKEKLIGRLDLRTRTGMEGWQPSRWDDAFDVEFDDGLSFLEPHKTIRKANKISPKAEPVEVAIDEECRIGFDVHYDNGQVAEVSWAFIRELSPKDCPHCK